jgi:hypothetical protein
MNPTDRWWDSLDGGSARRKALIYTGQHRQLSMPRVGFKTTILVVERVRLIRAVDSADTLVGHSALPFGIY